MTGEIHKFNIANEFEMRIRVSEDGEAPESLTNRAPGVRRNESDVLEIPSYSGESIAPVIESLFGVDYRLGSGWVVGVVDRTADGDFDVWETQTADYFEVFKLENCERCRMRNVVLVGLARWMRSWREGAIYGKVKSIYLP